MKNLIFCSWNLSLQFLLVKYPYYESIFSFLLTFLLHFFRFSLAQFSVGHWYLFWLTDCDAKRLDLVFSIVLRMHQEAMGRSRYSCGGWGRSVFPMGRIELRSHKLQFRTIPFPYFHFFFFLPIQTPFFFFLNWRISLTLSASSNISIWKVFSKWTKLQACARHWEHHNE